MPTLSPSQSLAIMGTSISVFRVYPMLAVGQGNGSSDDDDDTANRGDE